MSDLLQAVKAPENQMSPLSSLVTRSAFFYASAKAP
jgi:hypothetical protein